MRTFTLSDQACVVLDLVIGLAPVPRRQTDLLIMELNKSQSVVSDSSAESSSGADRSLGVPDMNLGTVETSADSAGADS